MRITFKTQHSFPALFSAFSVGSCTEDVGFDSFATAVLSEDGRTWTTWGGYTYTINEDDTVVFVGAENAFLAQNLLPEEVKQGVEVIEVEGSHGYFWGVDALLRYTAQKKKDRKDFALLSGSEEYWEYWFTLGCSEWVKEGRPLAGNLSSGGGKASRFSQSRRCRDNGFYEAA